MTATLYLQGIGIDFAFMVQKSRDTTRFNNLVGLNGETCYALITDHFSGRILVAHFATKAPPLDWLNHWLANNAPACPAKYVRMDGGGELGCCSESMTSSTIFGYQVQLTGPDSSHQNGPGERPHQTIGDALHAMLTGANLGANFWPYAFYHFCAASTTSSRTALVSPVHIHSVVAHSLISATLRTFGCRVHVRPTTAALWSRGSQFSPWRFPWVFTNVEGTLLL
jgi:hypothetical protein